MDERRSKPRLSVDLDAVCDGNAGKRSARLTDLSEDGCYLDSVGEVTTVEIVCFRILLWSINSGTNDQPLESASKSHVLFCSLIFYGLETVDFLSKRILTGQARRAAEKLH